ncbi:MAG: hypothetical protein OEX97_02070 [Acidimicrobiia bacterium]|nr:hypothetical protein [Acidimicrobiia bacterium]
MQYQAQEVELLRKGTRVKELTKKTGQKSRTGKVVGFHHDSVEVQWDDGHRSSLSGALLVPQEKSKTG